KPYFSLATNRSWGPGDKPTIQMWSQNLDALEFRVYRVKDPILFFQKMEDVHRVGAAAAPRKGAQLTLIERFHQFKLGARNAIRNGFRAQYTPDSRGTIRSLMYPAKAPPAPPATSFSGLPLLNSQQVVTVWRQNISHKERWQSEAISIPVTDKGLYLVEAAHQELRAYTIVNLTNLVIVAKTAPGRLVTFVTDRATNAPVADCPLAIWSNKLEAGRLRTDANGLADFQLSDTNPESTLVLARRGDDFAVDSLSGWNMSTDPDRYTIG